MNAEQQKGAVMVTIKYIAQRAGVSIATVSRVLNKTKYVSPEIEKRVLEVVEKYHYYPNTAAQALSSRLSHTLGVVYINNINMFQSEFVPFTYQYASSRGYSIIQTVCGESFESRLEALEMLQARHVDAILYSFEFFPDEIEKVREKIKIPILGVGFGRERGDSYLVEEYAACTAVKYLIELGHTKIGGIFPCISKRAEYISGRYDGYRRALNFYGIPINENYICFDVTGMSDVGEKLEKTIKKDDYPTAFFCYSDEVAVGAMLHLAQKGFRIPEDISLVGFDGIALGDRIKPRLTTVMRSTEACCRYEVAKIIAMIEGKEFHPSEDMSESGNCRLVIRESCCPPRDI